MMRLRTLLIIFILATGFWLWGFLRFNDKINHFQPDNQTHTDAIIVLTGGKNRIKEAVELLNQGLGDKLFISGVSQGISLHDLLKRGDITIRTKREITLDNRSTNTVENAIEATDWMKKNKITSVRLVTSNYHILRSELEFKSQNSEMQILLHPVYSENVSAKWWKNLGSFFLIAAEYNKYLVVYLRSLLGWNFNSFY